MLSLNDLLWAELDHRGWANGRRYSLDPEAPFVPDELAKLHEDPEDLASFNRLWPYLCSEGTAWAAAYAAVPHVVEMVKRLPPTRRYEFLSFVGSVVIHSRPELGESFAIKPMLMESYRRSLSEALPLLAEALVWQHNATETRYLLAAMAALKGHTRLADALEDLDSVHGQCPRCGETVYPEELRRAVEE